MNRLRQQQFGRLFTQHHGALRRYVQRFVGSADVADDLVQETFMRAYAQPAEARSPKSFLFTIAHNLAIKWLRHRKVAKTDLMGDPESLGVYELHAQLVDPLIADEELLLLKEAVEQLPPQCRAAFALRIFHEHSYLEIARLLGISPKTVEKHISRGLRETNAYLRRCYSPRATDADECAPRAAARHGSTSDENNG